MFFTWGCCHPSHFNQTRLPVYFAYFPEGIYSFSFFPLLSMFLFLIFLLRNKLFEIGTSCQEVVHYTQLVDVDTLQFHDWGKSGSFLSSVYCYYYSYRS